MFAYSIIKPFLAVTHPSTDLYNRSDQNTCHIRCSDWTVQVDFHIFLVNSYCTSPGFQHLCGSINKTPYVTLNKFRSNCAHFFYVVPSHFLFLIESDLSSRADQFSVIASRALSLKMSVLAPFSRITLNYHPHC